MTTWDWKSLLQQMNDAILSAPLVESFNLPPEVIEKKWIGYDPATEEQIAVAEARLGLVLPASYREFLKVSNGWRVCNPYMDAVFPVERIDLMRNTDPDLILNWEQRRQDAEQASVADIAHTIRVSAWTDMAVLLLNPQKSTPEGEWEAWFYSDNIPGAEVFPSFWDLMQDQLTGLLDAIDSYVPSPPQPTKDEREVIVSGIQHVRKAWLMTAEYDPIQEEVDAILARIRDLPSDNPAAFQAALQELVDELKGSSSNRQMKAQDLLTQLITSGVPTNTIDFIRRQAHLFIATAIEMYVK